MKQVRKADQTLVFSYLALRKAIGYLGVTLPLTAALGALIIFHTGLRSSLSAYYYTGMRDVFVGTLWAIGFFLLSYKGYERTDNIAGNLACVFAVGISLFPTTPDVNPAAAPRWVGVVHIIFATLFFLTLIYFSLFLFTKTHARKKPTPRKLQRNKVYQVCGYAMAACILLSTLYFLVPSLQSSSLQNYHPIFWFEATAILTFGISWLTKGEAILKDQTDS